MEYAVCNRRSGSLQADLIIFPHAARLRSSQTTAAVGQEKKKKKKICMPPDLQQLISGVPSPSHFFPLSERLSSCSFTPPLIPSLEAALECTPFQSRRLAVHVNVPGVLVRGKSTSLDSWGAFAARVSPPRMLVFCFEGELRPTPNL